jgi:putative endopeptidase
MAVTSDFHSPHEYRVNGIVPNIESWYDAFNVKSGDKLFRTPEDRVRIW